MIQIRFGKNFIYLETNKLIPSKEFTELAQTNDKDEAWVLLNQ